ncbi:hypothetical protein HELRODRAFT_190584 [Helobdella robusta]|uniref:Elongation of very long chain fatty acids protein n=1 Tax=Helobdella robusta TaxID=6412 RepID=T1FS42_HELRO|nr:hypothetical protein HELRODRAFT_190584 [Helobdella robusta]ESO08755.1 hypothetical protein HELRODRAFT_190584 [Helobdella robusta]
MPVKIFVGRLSDGTTKDDLLPLFKKFGNVVECDVLSNFGFVHMESEEEAQVAIAALDGYNVKDSHIHVELSTASTQGRKKRYEQKGPPFGRPPFNSGDRQHPYSRHGSSGSYDRRGGVPSRPQQSPTSQREEYASEQVKDLLELYFRDPYAFDQYAKTYYYGERLERLNASNRTFDNKRSSHECQHYLASKMFFEEAERSFDVRTFTTWIDSTKHHSFTISIIYMFLIYLGQKFMQNRKPYSLRYILFLWNAFLAVFSITGAYRSFPEWKNSYFIKGWHYSICDNSFYEDKITALWAFLFAASKFVELGDTFFLVFKKRPVIFLHWYHHVTVLIYCAYSYSDHVSSGRWYGAMNYFIHSIMYTYYAITALRIVRMPKAVSISITSLQLVQMVLGLVVTVSVLKAKLENQECAQSLMNAILAWLMYFSYFILFIQFFYEAYGPGSKKSSPDKPVKCKAA